MSCTLIYVVVGKSFVRIYLKEKYPCLRVKTSSASFLEPLVKGQNRFRGFENHQLTIHTYPTLTLSVQFPKCENCLTMVNTSELTLSLPESSLNLCMF